MCKWKRERSTKKATFRMEREWCFEWPFFFSIIYCLKVVKHCLDWKWFYCYCHWLYTLPVRKRHWCTWSHCHHMGVVAGCCPLPVYRALMATPNCIRQKDWKGIFSFSHDIIITIDTLPCRTTFVKVNYVHRKPTHPYGSKVMLYFCFQCCLKVFLFPTCQLWWLVWASAQ